MFSIGLNMFCIVLGIALLEYVTAVPVPDVRDQEATAILEYSRTPDQDGNYEFFYKTTNGLFRKEIGKRLSEDKFVVEGTYSYMDTDGVEHSVGYIADENGYRLKEPTVGIPSSTFALPPGVVASLLGK